MKKIICTIVLALAIVLSMSGCKGNLIEEETKTVINTPQLSFVEVGDCCGATIVYCKQTKVLYAVSTTSYNYGNFNVLVNADGTPMLWEGN